MNNLASKAAIKNVLNEYPLFLKTLEYFVLMCFHCHYNTFYFVDEYDVK